MKAPDIFARALRALNGEDEFSPNAICFDRLRELADGTKYTVTEKPYWVQLRDDAYAFYEMSGYKSGSPSPAREPDSLYQKAQNTFVHELRAMVEKWRESNWDLTRCFQRHPRMQQKIEQLSRREPLVLLAASGATPKFINPFGPTLVQRWPRGKDKPLARARRDAMILFVRLFQDSNHVRMGKCVRCGRYFFGRPGQKCCPRPRRCSSYLAAIESTKRRWKNDREAKLQEARAACDEWERRKSPINWKLWVADEVDVSVKWITRAVNAGELNEPLKL